MLLTACGSESSTTNPANVNTGNPTVNIDPTYAWTAPTSNCDGSIATNIAGYNVYTVPSTQTIPTTTITAIPCGALNVVDRTKITPMNTALITTTSYQTTLATGSYTAGITAVNISGDESALSNTITFNVELFTNPPGKPTVNILCLLGKNINGTCEK